jgi:1-acyl-sn-glycerol-3-phosphate acyltransferase
MRSPWTGFDAKFFLKILPLVNLAEKYFRYEVHGLSHLPRRGSALIVMNHGVLPFHALFFLKQIIEKRHRVPRALAAEFVFHLPFIKDFFRQIGALNASPQTAERLLRNGELLILHPGGIYESLLTKMGKSQIPWTSRRGFVRVAIKTGTPIIPSFCQGINETYFTSRILIRPRLKFLKMTRFSLPVFFGLGLLPLPAKLTQHVGRPISVKPRSGESRQRQIVRIHREVLRAMTRLART